MRLFEVDLGSARDVLAVLQGLADRSDQPTSIPFASVMKLIQPFGLGINTPDGLIALKDRIDPAGDVISNILDNGTVVLRTAAPNPDDKQAELSQGPTPAVDSMASSNAKQLAPKF